MKSVGCDTDSLSADGGGAGAADGRTLVAGALDEGSAGDDRDSSSSDEDGQVEPGTKSSSPAKPNKPASPARAAPIRGGAAASTAPVDESPAKGGRGSLRGKEAGRDAVIDEQPVLDVRDFTTWTPKTWELLDLSGISFPEDRQASYQQQIVLPVGYDIFSQYRDAQEAQSFA